MYEKCKYKSEYDSILQGDFSNNAVHVWRACLSSIPAWQIRKLSQTLSHDERDRAERFHFEKHRKYFIACRGFLRKILSTYLDIEPSLVQFSYEPYGKPVLSSMAKKAFSFNLSHSNDLALYSIARYGAVGIDIEYIRPMRDIDQLAKRFFTQNEYELMRSFSKEQKHKIFFNLWVLKEAYLKATGEGLSGLEQVEVTFDSKRKVTLLREGNTLSTCCWDVHHFTPMHGYLAALVIKR
mmetsp:Transcript_22024/g.10381  ORF Transcript_22024/g.10381 Transcript_22024/m.10381 type:complete len:238 (-) Transcript_22024:1184-1897(-)